MRHIPLSDLNLSDLKVVADICRNNIDYYSHLPKEVDRLEVWKTRYKIISDISGDKVETLFSFNEILKPLP